jgi:hypothetical protein
MSFVCEKIQQFHVRKWPFREVYDFDNAVLIKFASNIAYYEIAMQNFRASTDAMYRACRGKNKLAYSI